MCVQLESALINLQSFVIELESSNSIKELTNTARTPAIRKIVKIGELSNSITELSNWITELSNSFKDKLN